MNSYCVLLFFMIVCTFDNNLILLSFTTYLQFFVNERQLWADTYRNLKMFEGPKAPEYFMWTEYNNNKNNI